MVEYSYKVCEIMIKKLSTDVVIGNAIYSIDKKVITKDEINKYINIAQKILNKQGFYLECDNPIEEFCRKYYFLVSMIDDNIIVNVDKENLKIYFVLQITPNLTETFKKTEIKYNDEKGENFLVKKKKR